MTPLQVHWAQSIYYLGTWTWTLRAIQIGFRLHESVYCLRTWTLRLSKTQDLRLLLTTVVALGPAGFRVRLRGLRVSRAQGLQSTVLGGSWAVVSGVISPLIQVMTIVILLITLLVTTHEPPSKRDCKGDYTTLVIELRGLLSGVQSLFHLTDCWKGPKFESFEQYYGLHVSRFRIDFYSAQWYSILSQFPAGVPGFGADV